MSFSYSSRTMTVALMDTSEIAFANFVPESSLFAKISSMRLDEFSNNNFLIVSSIVFKSFLMYSAMAVACKYSIAGRGKIEKRGQFSRK